MDVTEFHKLTDKLFNEIEQQLDHYADEYDTDIDYETLSRVISVTFVNNSKIIINTQEPLLQIWMATNKQGYHFDFRNGNWICNRSGISFNQLFNEAVKNQIE